MSIEQKPLQFATEMAATFDVKHRSRILTEGPERAAARAYLKGIGYDDEALSKPLVAVANTWIETMPCNFHLRALAAKVKEGIRAAGGTPMELNTISISDGITMGLPGMRASLVSREVIADSIELVVDAHQFDAVIAIAGCDKTAPGAAMALARLNIPGLVLYGGSILPGHYRGRDITIQEVFEAIGAHAVGKITDAELLEIENVASPGAGSCGGQFTANTMAMAFEVLGISPVGFSMIPAVVGEKSEAAEKAGEIVMDVLRRGLRPSDVITKQSLANAIAAIAMSGGSTNGSPAPARGRHRDGRGAVDRRLRRDQRSYAAAVRHGAVRHVCRPGPVACRRGSARAEAAQASRPAE